MWKITSFKGRFILSRKGVAKPGELIIKSTGIEPSPDNHEGWVVVSTNIEFNNPPLDGIPCDLLVDCVEHSDRVLELEDEVLELRSDIVELNSIIRELESDLIYSGNDYGNMFNLTNLLELQKAELLSKFQRNLTLEDLEEIELKWDIKNKF